MLFRHLIISATLALPALASAQSACEEAPRTVQLDVGPFSLFQSSKGFEKITFISKFNKKTARLQDLVPDLRAGFTGMTYLVKNHRRFFTTGYLVVDAELLQSNNEELQTLLRVEKTFDDKITEYVLIRKKVMTELVNTVRSYTRQQDSFETILQKYQYLAINEVDNLTPELETIQAHVRLYFKMNTHITQTQIQKKAMVTDDPLMVELRRKQRSVAEKMTDSWFLVVAGCHNAESRYQVYENSIARGTYLIFESQTATK